MSMFRGVRVYYTIVDTALSKSGLPGLDYALNPYLGCSHGCIYCYARMYTRDKRASSNWGRVVVVKKNLVDVLREEVARYKPGTVGVGTITDPYQPVEAIYGLTRRSIETLVAKGFQVSIQTKNPLVLRDLELLAEHRSLVDVGFTITTLEWRKASLIEPSAPPPRARALALRKLAGKGVKTWVFYGPIIPGFNDGDEEIEVITSLAAETGSALYYDPLHVKPFMKSPLYPLSANTSMVRRDWWRRVEKRIRETCREKRVVCKGGFTA